MHTDEFYVNGLSTSLPSDVQTDFLRTIFGLERAEIMRPGYAVEYDFFPPVQLQSSLETKAFKGLFFAGQVNGTSGYEEAAAQGLVAGANAARRAQGQPPFILPRATSYIGVMIDDLVTKGTDEPYRMFSSRAENRLTLRHDNADQRLTPRGRDVGLVSDRRWRSFQEKAENLSRARAYTAARTNAGRSMTASLKKPNFAVDTLPSSAMDVASLETWKLVQTELRYEGYLKRIEAQDRNLQLQDNQTIPEDLDFESVPSLRAETRQKLSSKLPSTLGEAAKISGITAADIDVLFIFLRKKNPKVLTVPKASFA